MLDFVLRLMKCGYSYDDACAVCKDFLTNLPIWELGFFVTSVEDRSTCG